MERLFERASELVYQSQSCHLEASASSTALREDYWIQVRANAISQRQTVHHFIVHLMWKMTIIFLVFNHSHLRAQARLVLPGAPDLTKCEFYMQSVSDCAKCLQLRWDGRGNL